MPGTVVRITMCVCTSVRHDIGDMSMHFARHSKLSQYYLNALARILLCTAHSLAEQEPALTLQARRSSCNHCVEHRRSDTVRRVSSSLVFQSMQL